VPKGNGNWLGNRFENLADAEANEASMSKVSRVETSTMDEFASLPEGKNNHRTYYDASGSKLFTLVKTPCCSETPAGPTLTWRWWSSAN
jgi:hypothetical protein